MKIKKFSDYKLPKEKETKEKELTINQKRIENDTMSDSLNDTNLEIPIEKLKDGEFEIVGINDISLDKPKNEAMIVNADLGDNNAKRGDVLWITAMVKKKNVNWNSMAVLKVRIVDIYNGLSILNTLK